MAKSSLFSVFATFVDANQFKTVTKYDAGRLIRTSLGLFSGLIDQSDCAIWNLCDTQQPVLYITQCFGRFVEANQFKYVTKYVAGRLIRTSLRLFLGLDDNFYCMIWHQGDKYYHLLYMI